MIVFLWSGIYYNSERSVKYMKCIYSVTDIQSSVLIYHLCSCSLLPWKSTVKLYKIETIFVKHRKGSSEPSVLQRKDCRADSSAEPGDGLSISSIKKNQSQFESHDISEIARRNSSRLFSLPSHLHCRLTRHWIRMIEGVAQTVPTLKIIKVRPVADTDTRL